MKFCFSENIIFTSLNSLYKASYNLQVHWVQFLPPLLLLLHLEQDGKHLLGSPRLSPMASAHEVVV